MSQILAHGTCLPSPKPDVQLLRCPICAYLLTAMSDEANRLALEDHREHAHPWLNVVN